MYPDKHPKQVNKTEFNRLSVTGDGCDNMTL